jgi:hypothetical protein
MQIINHGVVNIERNTEKEPAERPAPALGDYANAAGIIADALQSVGVSPEKVMEFLKCVCEPFGFPVTENRAAYASRGMYTATQIASKLGIFSTQGRPHAHAVSAILKHNIYIGEEHTETLVLFETADFTVYYTRYDGYALERVQSWVNANGMPSEVDGAYYTYWVQYKPRR